ncbi:MAG: glycosyltransferase family 2 protein [Planctomycetota bacterium]
MKRTKYSVVIPVYNSEGIVGTTIDRACAFFEKHGFDYEIILVNDGSRDGSWEVVRDKARGNPRLIAMNLLHNYGQHTAVLCGLRKSAGDYVITLDDDMQNPPEEMIRLIEKAKEGCDLVVGKFQQKKHALYRRWGSIVIGAVNRRIFHQPKDLNMSSFRLIRRDVVDRICSYRTSYPYITGLALMFSANRANVMVDHRDREVGKSNYNVFKITELVMRILFNYSAVPLRVVSTMAFIVAAISFLLALFYFARGLIVERSVPGWTSLIVLLSFFNAVTILILSMLGEYTVRLLNQTSAADVYHVKETIERGD